MGGQYAARPARAITAATTPLYIFQDRQPPAIAAIVRPARPGRRFGPMKKNTKTTPLDALSPRELEVFRLVVEGRTSKEIAGVMGVKPGTVDTYRSRIMEKLEISDIANLVRLAIRYGLIKL